MYEVEAIRTVYLVVFSSNLMTRVGKGTLALIFQNGPILALNAIKGR